MGGGLSHYGITGQKWGVRRFENEDGTLTEEGKARYSLARSGGNRKLDRDYKRDLKKLSKLDEKANLKVQKERAIAKAESARKAGFIAIGSLLSAIGANKMDALSKTKVTDTWIIGIGGYGDTGHGHSSYEIPDRTINDVLHVIGLVSAASFGTKAAINAGQSRAAKKRTTKEGHEIAVAKSSGQYEYMQNKYRGTKYENYINSYGKSRKS